MTASALFLNEACVLLNHNAAACLVAPVCERNVTQERPAVTETRRRGVVRVLQSQIHDDRDDGTGQASTTVDDELPLSNGAECGLVEQRYRSSDTRVADTA